MTVQDRMYTHVARWKTCVDEAEGENQEDKWQKRRIFVLEKPDK